MRRTEKPTRGALQEVCLECPLILKTLQDQVSLSLTIFQRVSPGLELSLADAKMGALLPDPRGCAA